MSKHASTNFIDVSNMTGAEWKKILESEDVVTISFETMHKLTTSKYKLVKSTEAIGLYIVYKSNLEFYTPPSTVTLLAKQLKMSKARVILGIKELVRLGILDENEIPYE